MHPWKKIIRGNTQEEETTTCFMCLERVTNLKFEKHMTKFHAATCPMARLDEMCREAEEEQATEGLNFDEIIEEERERQETLRKYRMETGGLMGMFNRRQEPANEPEQGTQDTISLKCFLCQGKWTGNSKKELTEHLENTHKVVFKVKDLIELSESQPEEPDTAADEERPGCHSPGRLRPLANRRGAPPPLPNSTNEEKRDNKRELDYRIVCCHIL